MIKIIVLSTTSLAKVLLCGSISFAFANALSADSVEP